MPTVLNVGCGHPKIPIPPHYQGWTQVRLDIDATYAPDIILDARELAMQTPGVYDAVYCAHNLEHYHRHEGQTVLMGFRHVLKPDGFAEIRVPDLGNVIEAMVQNKMDIDDVLYQSALGPILIRDVIYGYHPEIERAGQEFFAHKTGFTKKSLHDFILRAGFNRVVLAAEKQFQTVALAFCSKPTHKQIDLFNLPEQLCQ